METEFCTEISDQVLLVQPVRAARRHAKIMVGVVGRQYAVEVADEYLIFRRIDQALLVDTFKKALGDCPVAFHNPGCKRANSARVGRSQLYHRLFAISSRRTRRAGIFGRTCRMYGVPFFMFQIFIQRLAMVMG